VLDRHIPEVYDKLYGEDRWRLAVGYGFTFNLRVDSVLYDALVIGGGPGGSAAATYLARGGRKVLLLEKEVFPRFHIGESLLPYNRAIFEEMGVLPALEASGFPQKFGAQFHIGSGEKCTGFVFRNGRYTRETRAIQVERATFDHLLLKHAAKSGAEVREGWTVQRFSQESGGGGQESVAIQARSPEGQMHEFGGRFLIDASGRGNMTGNQEDIRTVHPKLRKLAIFGHFTGVQLDPGERAGDTVIIRLADKWFWIIPITAEKTSVGCVMDADEFAREKKSPGEVFNQWVQSSPVLRARMDQARLIGQMHATSDFSYYNRRLVGKRLVRVGDAAGFLDPIFSSGVYIAMYSGRLAALAVMDALTRHNDGTRLLAAYEKRVLRAMNVYWEMVEGFYTKPFMEVFMEPRDKWNLPAAVNAILAGELDAPWRLRWRLRLFYFLIKLQGRWPFLPKLSFQ
jgi:flavin-dependent dehydrogenase